MDDELSNSSDEPDSYEVVSPDVQLPMKPQPLEYRPANSPDHKPDMRRIPSGPSFFTGATGAFTGIILPFLILFYWPGNWDDFFWRTVTWVAVSLPVIYMAYRIGSNSAFGSWCTGFTVGSAAHVIIRAIFYALYYLLTTKF